MITVADLSHLIDDQILLLQHYAAQPDDFAPTWHAAGRDCIIVGQPWHIVPGHLRWECTGADGRTVIMKAQQSSAFDFAAFSLARYIATRRPEAASVNEMAVENWLLQAYRRGRIAPSAHDRGYWTFAG